MFESVPLHSEMIHVGPGQLVVSSGSRVLRTVVGSGVSVCLWDSHLRLGGMNHFMLPESTSPVAASLRHGDFAMRALLKELQRAGSRASQLSASVNGGASVLERMACAQRSGWRNVEFALEWLERERIPVHTAHVLGTAARSVKFDLRSGLSRVRLVEAGR